MGNEDVRERLFDLKGRLAKMEALVKNAETSQQNKDTIFAFEQHLLTKQISIPRVIKYIQFAKTIAVNYDKDFVEYTKTDVDAVVTKLRLYGNQKQLRKTLRERKYKLASMNDFATCLKQLFRFIEGLGDDEQSLRVRHLKQKRPQSTLRREDLLTDDEINRLIAAMPTPVYQAFTSLLADTGMRIGEARGILLQDMKKNVHGYRVYVDGKTGRRPCFAIISEPLITKIINSHIDKNNPTAPLFYMVKRGKMLFLRHTTYAKTLKVLGKNVLGRPNITPYTLRHTYCTKLILRKVPEAVIRKAVGHSPTSRALATYTHLVDEDVENEMFRLAGLPSDNKQQPSAFVAKSCPKCGLRLSPHEAICSCGAIIDSGMIAVKEEKPKFDFSTLNEEEKAFMREELRKMAMELAKEIHAKG